jgi:hypothetical protein
VATAPADPQRRGAPQRARDDHPRRPSFELAGIDDRTAAASGVPGHGANLDAN